MSTPEQVVGHANGRAIGALVMGVLSLVFFWGGWLFVAASAVAVALGVSGGRQAREGQGQQGVATAGLVLGIIGLVLEFLLLVSIGHP